MNTLSISYPLWNGVMMANVVIRALIAQGQKHGLSPWELPCQVVPRQMRWSETPDEVDPTLTHIKAKYWIGGVYLTIEMAGLYSNSYGTAWSLTRLKYRFAPCVDNRGTIDQVTLQMDLAQIHAVEAGIGNGGKWQKAAMEVMDDVLEPLVLAVKAARPKKRGLMEKLAFLNWRVRYFLHNRWMSKPRHPKNYGIISEED